MARNFQGISNISPYENTEKKRGHFVPIAVLTRDSLQFMIASLNADGIDTKEWMYPPHPELPETQFVLYKLEVRFRDEEKAVRILSNLLKIGGYVMEEITRRPVR